MINLKKILMCGIVGAIFGGVLGSGESITLTVIFSIAGLVVVVIVYGLIYFIYYMIIIFRKCSGEAILSFHDLRDDTYLYSGDLIKNSSYRIDEYGNPNLDARWLSREHY